jgi:superfamily II DNA or RNA helicase
MCAQFFSLIFLKGPPGTGKTHVGTILAKILLSNVKNLVVLCYTNHALDSFLETLLDFTPKIIRIGGRSKSVKLEAHNLSTLKTYLTENGLRDQKMYNSIKAMKKKIQESESSSKNEIKKLNRYVSIADPGHILFLRIYVYHIP